MKRTDAGRPVRGCTGRAGRGTRTQFQEGLVTVAEREGAAGHGEGVEEPASGRRGAAGPGDPPGDPGQQRVQDRLGGPERAYPVGPVTDAGEVPGDEDGGTHGEAEQYGIPYRPAERGAWHG